MGSLKLGIDPNGISKLETNSTRGASNTICAISAESEKLNIQGVQNAERDYGLFASKTFFKAKISAVLRCSPADPYVSII